MSRYIIAVLLLLCFTTPANAEIFKWKTVGASPYTGTVDWVLNQRSGFSQKTNEMLRKEIAADNGTVGKLCGGENIQFTTFGNDGIKYDVLTDWDKEVCYTTTEYSVVNGNYLYTLMHVWKCDDWSGKRVEVAEEAILASLKPQQKSTSAFGDGSNSTSSDIGGSTTSNDASSLGNPGNHKAVGSAGESPNGQDFGDGATGQGDVNGGGNNGNGGNGKGNGGKGKN